MRVAVLPTPAWQSLPGYASRHACPGPSDVRACACRRTRHANPMPFLLLVMRQRTGRLRKKTTGPMDGMAQHGRRTQQVSAHPDQLHCNATGQQTGSTLPHARTVHQQCAHSMAITNRANSWG